MHAYRVLSVDVRCSAKCVPCGTVPAISSSKLYLHLQASMFLCIMPYYKPCLHDSRFIQLKASRIEIVETSKQVCVYVLRVHRLQVRRDPSTWSALPTQSAVVDGPLHITY